MKTPRRATLGLIALSAFVGIGVVVSRLIPDSDISDEVAPGHALIATGPDDRFVDDSQRKNIETGIVKPDDQREARGASRSETPASSEESAEDVIVGKIAPESVQQFVRDCPGKNWMPCPAIKDLAERVARAPDELDDGWPGWMRDEIQQSLVSVAKKNGFTSIGAKCTNEACVFFVASETSIEMFGGDLDSVYEFDAWLSTRPWSDELEKLPRDRARPSPVAWRLEGTDGRPYVIWYVVQRRP